MTLEEYLNDGSNLRAVPTIRMNPRLINFEGRFEPSSEAAGESLGNAGDRTIVGTNRNLGEIAPPGLPRLEAMRPRDIGRENHQAGDAALMAGAFGLGLGSFGGVAAAPSLAAMAAQGARQGAETAYRSEAAQVGARNDVALDDYRARDTQWRNQQVDANRRGDEWFRSDQNERTKTKAKSEYMQSLVGLPAESLQARLENDFRSGVHGALGIQFGKREDGAWDVQPVADPILAEREAARRAREEGALGDDVRQLVDAVRRTAPDGRQAVLNAVAPGLMARGAALTQDELGNWTIPGVDLGALDTALPASMSPEAQSINRRKVVERSIQSTQDLFELLVRDPRTTAGARAELLKRQGILKDALATGSDVPNWVYEISPSAIADMSPQQREALRLRDEAIDASRDRTRQMGGQFQQSYNQRERFHKDYITGKKEDGRDGKSWEREGIKSINAIDDDVARMIQDVAQLKNGAMQKSATGAYLLDEKGDPVRLKPSQNDIDAANDLVNQIREYQRQQDDIAASYGYRRNPATRRWEKTGGAK